MSDLILSPATQELADSLSDASANSMEPGKFGAVPFFLAGMSASGAALMIEGILTDYLGDAARAVIESQKGLISQFLAPKLADLGAEILAEFGSNPGA